MRIDSLAAASTVSSNLTRTADLKVIATTELYSNTSVAGLLGMQSIQTDTQNAATGYFWVDTMGFVRMST